MTAVGLIEFIESLAVIFGVVIALFTWRADKRYQDITASLEWDRYLKETRDPIFADGIDIRRFTDHMNRLELVCSVLRKGTFPEVTSEHLADLICNDLAGLAYVSQGNDELQNMVLRSITSKETYVDIAWFHANRRKDIENRTVVLRVNSAAAG